MPDSLHICTTSFKFKQSYKVYFMITICSNGVSKTLGCYSKDTELVGDRAGSLNLGLDDSEAYIFSSLTMCLSKS